MITGLLYASCGDLQRSEDLAQDTFISAWKSLSGLRDPGKLSAWLCQIARHRFLDDSRSAAGEKVRLSNLWTDHKGETAQRPEQELISAEERYLLWHTLSEISQPYRETLVLYYRQGQSTAAVAAAMETNESNVRQRLSRGREMMREQVAAMLERNLSRTAPSAAFAVAVVAALPALIPTTAKAATLATVAKGSAAAQGTGFLATLAFFIGPIMALFVGAEATAHNIRSTQTPRERRFVIRASIALGLIVAGFTAANFASAKLATHFHLRPATYFVALAGFWTLYGCVILTWKILTHRRRQSLRLAQGLGEIPPMSPMPMRFKPFWALAAVTFSTVAALAMFAWRAKDKLGVEIVVAAGILLIIATKIGTRRKSPAALGRYAMLHGLMLGALILIILNWRYETWMATLSHITVPQMQRLIPLWSVNLLVIALIGWIEILAGVSLLLQRAGRRCA
jgi:RNA polymerase sigma factor (sigma-70 family)